MQYLVFSLYGSRYGIRVGSVREIILLPELTPVTEAPPYITGMFNFRGRIVPTMDLHVRLGYKPQNYNLTDRIIVLEQDEILTALIVDQVLDVQEIPRALIEPPPSYGQGGESYSRFFEGIARLDDNIVVLLDLEQLISRSASLRNLYREEGDVEELEAVEPVLEITDHPVFMKDFTEGDREVLKNRAAGLLRQAENKDDTGMRPMAVVELGDELYGVALDVVVEFGEVRNITPVPCTPRHIVGCLNLRGSILTVVDVRGILNLEITNEDPIGRKVVVVQVNEIYAGVLVNEVSDVLYIAPNEIHEAPAAVRASGDYITGTYQYGERLVGLLDLGRVIEEGNLVVNESA